LASMFSIPYLLPPHTPFYLSIPLSLIFTSSALSHLFIRSFIHTFQHFFLSPCFISTQLIHMSWLFLVMYN
jgi:hypothetical protein